jgi:hypothetical protein
MLNVIVLSVVILDVIMLCVIMLSVAAPIILGLKKKLDLSALIPSFAVLRQTGELISKISNIAIGVTYLNSVITLEVSAGILKGQVSLYH